MKAKRLRRTSLYVPGTNPGMLANATVYGADSVILDLEDGVCEVLSRQDPGLLGVLAVFLR